MTNRRDISLLAALDRLTAGLDPVVDLAFRRIVGPMLSNEGSLIDDGPKLGRLTKSGRRWTVVRAALLERGLTYIAGGRLKAKLVDDVMAHASSIRAKRQRAGRIGAQSRWDAVWEAKWANTLDDAMANAVTSPPAPSGQAADILPLDTEARSLAIACRFKPGSEEEIRAAVAAFLKHRPWPRRLGPEPGAHGSACSPELLYEIALQTGAYA